MNAKRLRVSFAMTLREFTRRRGMILLMLALPLLTFALVRFALADLRVSVDAIERGVHVSIETSQMSLYAGVTAIIYVAMLASVTGFYVLSSALRTDRRLILAGYSPVELMSARFLMLAVVAAAITIEQFGLMLLFFVPKQPLPYLLGLYWAALLYALVGALTGALIRSELGGILTATFFSNLDVGTFQIPGLSAVADELWVKALPGFLPVRLAIDAAFTSVPDWLWQSFLAIPYALVLGAVTLEFYGRATHVHKTFMPEGVASRVPAWAIYVVIAVLAAGGAWGFAAYRAGGHVLAAEGRIEARNQEVLAPTSGLLRVLAIAVGDEVRRGQTIGWVADSLTNVVVPVRASLAGRVTKVEVELGQYVVAGAPLATVHDFATLEAVLEVEETDLPGLAAGQTVEVTFASLGTTTTSRIDSILPIPLPPEVTASEQTRKIRKYQVKCPVPQTDERLKVGMAVKARIYLDTP